MSTTILKWKAENTKHCDFPVSNSWNTYNYTIEQPHSYIHSILNTKIFSSHHCRSVSIQDMSVLLVTTYYRDLNIVKKGKTIIKRNEVHVLKALVKIVVKLYNKKKLQTFTKLHIT